MQREREWSEPKPHFSCSIRIKSGQGRPEQLPDDEEEVDIHKGVHVCACAGQTEGGGGGRDKEGKEIDLMKGPRVGREEATRIGRAAVSLGCWDTT